MHLLFPCISGHFNPISRESKRSPKLTRCSMPQFLRLMRMARARVLPTTSNDDQRGAKRLETLCTRSSFPCILLKRDEFMDHFDHPSQEALLR